MDETDLFAYILYQMASSDMCCSYCYEHAKCEVANCCELCKSYISWSIDELRHLDHRSHVYLCDHHSRMLIAARRKKMRITRCWVCFCVIAVWYTPLSGVRCWVVCNVEYCLLEMFPLGTCVYNGIQEHIEHCNERAEPQWFAVEWSSHRNDTQLRQSPQHSKRCESWCCSYQRT